jgi:hypothetical protein
MTFPDGGGIASGVPAAVGMKTLVCRKVEILLGKLFLNLVV